MSSFASLPTWESSRGSRDRARRSLTTTPMQVSAGRRDRIVRRLRAHRDWLADRAALLHDVPAERILDAARATSDFDARVESELRGALGELNALVARHNLKVPLGLQIPPLALEHLRGRSERD